MKVHRAQRGEMEMRAVETIRAHYSGQHEDEHAVAEALDKLKLIVALEEAEQRLRGVTPKPYYRYAEGAQLVTPRTVRPGANEDLPAVVLMGWGEVTLAVGWKSMASGKFERAPQHDEAWLRLDAAGLKGKEYGHEDRATLRVDGAVVIVPKLRVPRETKAMAHPDFAGEVIVPPCRLELDMELSVRRGAKPSRGEPIPGTTRRRLGRLTVVGRKDKPRLKDRRSGSDVRHE